MAQCRGEGNGDHSSGAKWTPAPGQGELAVVPGVVPKRAGRKGAAPGNNSTPEAIICPASLASPARSTPDTVDAEARGHRAP